MNYYRLRATIKRHEGFRRFAYDDATGETVPAPKGKLTIGYGWNLQAHGLPALIAEELLDSSISEAERGARKIFGSDFDRLSNERQEVIVSMAFNMGESRLRKFVNTIAAIKAGDWRKARAEMLDSKWAKQVGPRAVELAVAMERGRFEMEHT